MIYAGAASPPVLAAYAIRIQIMAVQFAPPCWAIIYQSENRFRREQLEILRRTESEGLDTAIVTGNQARQAAFGLTCPGTMLRRSTGLLPPGGTRTLPSRACWSQPKPGRLVRSSTATPRSRQTPSTTWRQHISAPRRQMQAEAERFLIGSVVGPRCHTTTSRNRH